MNFSLDIATLRRLYRTGELTPLALVEDLLDRMRVEDSHRIWIQRLDADTLRAYAKRLEGRDMATLPLYGIPFAIKDNIDLAGVPTTAACPDFAYMPERSATVVQRLIDAGAIPVGKTNLDQFATGLVGSRSPHGQIANPFSQRHSSGGPGSDSAVVVSLGMAAFALGTDGLGPCPGRSLQPGRHQVHAGPGEQPGRLPGLRQCE